MRIVIKSYYKILNYLLRINFHLTNGIQIGKNVNFNGIPIIYVKNSGSVVIGDNVWLNSNNSVYHINMHSPCKLIADRNGASINIGNESRIHGTCIHAYVSIIIGKRCLIAANTQIIDGNGHHLSMENPSNRMNTIGRAKQITIGDDVWIGANTFILPGTTIGNGSVVTAGSIVKGIFPKNSLIGGNPAKILKKYRNEEFNNVN